MIKGPHNRRPDIVVFIYGLPLGLIELKNAADEEVTITVVRRQAALTSLIAATQLLAGDKVSVASPLPALTPALGDYRDYCFVPGSGSDQAVATLQKIMETRPQSTRLKLPASLEDFIDALSDKEIVNPIRHLYIGSHANDAGDLFMPLQGSSPADAIDYEALEAAEKSGILKIDPKLLAPRPAASGQNNAAQFRVRGCRIGKAKPFLNQLKKALGGTITVNAPKHFEHVAKWSQPDGHFEYMDYDFQLRRPKALTTKKEMLTAFLAAGFTDIDGKPMAATLLNAGIPANVQKLGEQSTDTNVKVPFAPKIFKTPLSFRYHREQFRSGMSGFALDADPGKLVVQKAELKNQLLTDSSAWPEFAAEHAFPEWMRLGYASLDELLDGFSWTFKYDAKKKILFFNGERHVYDLIIPITESGTTMWLCNFYPSGSAGAVMEKMDAADKRLYETS